MYFTDDYGYRHGYDEDENEQLAPYLTPREVMALLNIGKNTVYKLLDSGKLKGFRIGKQWRVPREALVHFSQSHK